MLGIVALVGTQAGGYLIAGGSTDFLLTFIGLSVVSLAFAGLIVASRASWYRKDIHARLCSLIPREKLLTGSYKVPEQLDNDKLFDILDEHIQQQQELLSSNCYALIGSNDGKSAGLLHAEDELQRIKTELNALADQFRSEKKPDADDYPG